MLIKSRYILSIGLILAVMTSFLGSCNEDEKMNVLSASKLEDILYDYHLVEAMVNYESVDSAEAVAYFDAVLKNHNVSQADFDSTMIYYFRHADKMEEIYASLTERIENEARLQGVEGAGASVISTDLSADTANIWNKERTIVFCSKPPFNIVKFSFKSDSTMHPGDKFTLNYTPTFLYQDGARNCYGVLSVKLANDSVVTRTSSLSGPTLARCEVSDMNDIGIKEISGFIMQRLGNFKTDRMSSTLRLMLVSDIQLVRIHKKIDNNKDNKNNDNEKTDSIMRPASDTLHHPRVGLHKLHSR